MALSLNEYFSPSNYEIMRFVYFGDPISFPTVDRWQDLKDEIEAEINKFEVEYEKQLSELNGKLTQLENRVATNEGDIALNAARIEAVKTEIEGLEARIAALEKIKIAYISSNKSIAVTK